MENMVQRQSQLNREKVRRQVLGDAYTAGSRGWTDMKQLGIFQQLQFDCTLDQLHNALTFLEDQDLIKLQKLATEWRYTITSKGTHAWEGNIEWPLGIAQRVL